MPYQVQHSRFGLALQKLLGIQGAVIPQLVEDVFPMLQLEVEGPELHFLRGWVRWGFSESVAASVGNFGQVFIQPVKDTLVVVDQVIVATNPARVGLRNGLGAGVANSLPMDSRNTNTQVALVPNSIGPQDSGPIFAAASVLAANAILVVPGANPQGVGGFVLNGRLGGTTGDRVAGLAIESQNVNSAYFVTVTGRARALTDTEMTAS